MAENQGLDLSRVVNLIMENPKLIEEISALANADKSTEKEEVNIAPTVQPQNVNASEQTEKQNMKPQRNRRNELLCAMKPYLSKERAKAIDSVLTVVEILGVMREG